MKPGDMWCNTNTNEIWELKEHWHYKGIHKLDHALVDDDGDMKYIMPIDCSDKCIELKGKPQ